MTIASLYFAARYKAERVPPLVWRLALATLLLAGLLLALGLYQRRERDDDDADDGADDGADESECQL